MILLRHNDREEDTCTRAAVALHVELPMLFPTSHRMSLETKYERAHSARSHGTCTGSGSRLCARPCRTAGNVLDCDLKLVPAPFQGSERLANSHKMDW